jgi:hypothetical protein
MSQNLKVPAFHVIRRILEISNTYMNTRMSTSDFNNFAPSLRTAFHITPV